MWICGIAGIRLMCLIHYAWTLIFLEKNMPGHHLINVQFPVPNNSWSNLWKWPGKKFLFLMSLFRLFYMSYKLGGNAKPWRDFWSAKIFRTEITQIYPESDLQVLCKRRWGGEGTGAGRVGWSAGWGLYLCLLFRKHTMPPRPTIMESKTI